MITSKKSTVRRKNLNKFVRNSTNLILPPFVYTESLQLGSAYDLKAAAAIPPFTSYNLHCSASSSANAASTAEQQEAGRV